MTEDPTAVRALIARGESIDVELKSDLNDAELIETVVCLANGGGESVLIGVEDDGTVTGPGRDTAGKEQTFSLRTGPV